MAGSNFLQHHTEGSTLDTYDRPRLQLPPVPRAFVKLEPKLSARQMLHAASQASPRSVYVCGNTTSTTGLTVCAVVQHSNPLQSVVSVVTCMQGGGPCGVRLKDTGQFGAPPLDTENHTIFFVQPMMKWRNYFQLLRAD